jgi:hypothetical protein
VQEIRRLAALEAPTQRDSSSDTKGQLGVMLAQIGVLLISQQHRLHSWPQKRTALRAG